MRNAGIRVQFRRDVRFAQQLQEVGAALGWYRHVRETVEQDRWREALDVGAGRRELPRFLAAPLRHRKLTAEAFPRSTGHGVVRKTGRHVGGDASVASLAFKLRAIRRRRREERQMTTRRIAGDRDSRGVDAELRRIRARPSNRRLHILDLRRPPRRAVRRQPVLRCNIHVPARAHRLQACGEIVLAASLEAAAMIMNNRHPLVRGASRLVDIQVQVGVATLPVDDVFLDVHGGCRRCWRLCIERQVRQCNAGCDDSQKRSSRHVMT